MAFYYGAGLTVKLMFGHLRLRGGPDLPTFLATVINALPLTIKPTKILILGAGLIKGRG